MGTLSCYICAMSPKPSPQDWWGLDGFLTPNGQIWLLATLEHWGDHLCSVTGQRIRKKLVRRERKEYSGHGRIRWETLTLLWPRPCLRLAIFLSWGFLTCPCHLHHLLVRALTNKDLFSSPSTHSSATSPKTKVPSLTQVSTPLRPPSSSLLMAQLLEPPAHQTFLLRSHRCLKLKFLLFFIASYLRK